MDHNTNLDFLYYSTLSTTTYHSFYRGMETLAFGTLKAWRNLIIWLAMHTLDTHNMVEEDTKQTACMKFTSGFIAEYYNKKERKRCSILQSFYRHLRI